MRDKQLCALSRNHAPRRSALQVRSYSSDCRTGADVRTTRRVVPPPSGLSAKAWDGLRDRDLEHRGRRRHETARSTAEPTRSERRDTAVLPGRRRAEPCSEPLVRSSFMMHNPLRKYAADDVAMSAATQAAMRCLRSSPSRPPCSAWRSRRATISHADACLAGQSWSPTLSAHPFPLRRSSRATRVI